MTNAEKFEEVFGYKLNSNYLNKFTCAMFNKNPCKRYDFDCNKCPCLDFWNKEYKGRVNDADSD